MKTVVLLTKDKELKAAVEKNCKQQGLSMQLPLTMNEWNEHFQKSNNVLGMLDLDEASWINDMGNIHVIVFGQPNIISDRIDILGQCEDIIPKPVMTEVMVFKLNKVIEKLDMAEEFKKAREEIKNLDKDVNYAYEEWAKTDRVLKASLKEIENERNKLKELNYQLERLNAMKTDFLITVSHELRTPLSSIKAFAEILLDSETEPAETIEFLQIINNESNRLERLINNLLMASYIETSKICWRMTTVSIDKVIEKVVNTMQLDIKEKELMIEADISPDLPVVYGDQNKLVDAIDNLLSNAITFTPNGGTIKIRATKQITADKGIEVWVSIHDTGIGIKPEEQEKIFNSFHQIKENILVNKPKGIGLGLAICKKIIEHHGGRIWVESKYGEGSTFTFSLPITNK
ncbi:MAG: HAMP domain-containing sensor histidine kinase [Candidatus Desantisbacteria bacterium]